MEESGDDHLLEEQDLSQWSSVKNEHDATVFAAEEAPSTSSTTERVFSSPANAKLGYFLNANEQRVEAKCTCVLVLDYDFKKHRRQENGEIVIDYDRNGNDKDISNLTETFKSNRNCFFKQYKSKRREWVLLKISSETKLKKMFELKDNEAPDVFILIILSHGLPNGVIVLDTEDSKTKKLQIINTSEIIEALQTTFRKALKIVFFGPCRGIDDDTVFGALSQMYGDSSDTGCDQVCRINSFPNQDNFILVYATVEGTTSNRSRHTGTWLVRITCEVLNSLEFDESLESVLCKIQQKINLESLKRDILEQEGAQTVEVVYTAHQKFIVSRSEVENLSALDESRNGFFSWKSDQGEEVRERLAAIFCETETQEVNHLHQLLHTELLFETLVLSNTTKSHSNFVKAVSGGQSEYGCLFVCCFVEIRELDEQLYISVGNDAVPIGKVVQSFVGPLNEKWAGRPKILFILEQDDIEEDSCKKRRKMMKIKSTLYSGWFVLVLPYTDVGNYVFRLLSDPRLKDSTSSLQELAIELLRQLNFTGDAILPKISTTLPYLLDFPEWPLKYVHPRLTVMNMKVKETLTERILEVHDLSDEFVQSYLQGKDRKYCVYLVSAEAGAGKSTLLNDLTSKFRRVFDSIVVATLLYDEYKFFENNRLTKKDKLRKFINNDPYRKLRATDVALKSKSVIFVLDGFDEVCPDFREYALDLMENIAKARHPLWIATRPEEEDAIIDKLKRFEILKINICPFNREKQMELLKTCRKWSEEKIKSFLEPLEETVDKNLLENPLHLDLISKLDGSTKMNLFELYEKIVREYVDRSMNWPSDHNEYETKMRKWIEVLQKYALNRLAMNASNFVEQQFSKEEMVQIAKSGIVIVPSDTDSAKSRFVHQTFAEFLLAQRFVSDLEADKAPAVNLFGARNYQKSVEFVDNFLCDVAQVRCKKLKSKILQHLLKVQNFDEALKHIVGGAHARIFNMLRPKITFKEGGDEARKYVPESREILEESCNVRSQGLGVALLEMGALDKCPEKLELIKKIASNGCTKMLNKLITISPNILTNNPNAEPSIHAAEHNRLEMLRVLLTGHRVNVNLKNRDNQTALHKASAEGHIECIKLLISQGAEVNAVTNQGKTALHLAAESGHSEAVTYLLEKGANPKTEDLERRNSLHAAFVSESLETVKAFFSGTAIFAQEELKNRAEEFLRGAIYSRNADICSFVIESGATRNNIFEYGKFVMNHLLPKSRKRNSKELFDFACKIFIKTPNFVEISDVQEWTMLHLVVKGGNIQAADCLLRSGAKIEQKTIDGYTPFLVACRFHKGVRMVQLLLKNGANVNSCDNQMNTCLHLACAGTNWPILKELFEVFTLINAKNKNGTTALHIAIVKNYNLDVLADFYRYGADFYACDEKGLPPVCYAPEGFSLVDVEQRAKIRSNQQNMKSDHE